MLENDLVEAIIGLPTDMFYNTGISTYVWIVSNRKPAARNGKLQLIDASSFGRRWRKSLGSKRKELSPEHIDDITRLFGNFEEASVGRASARQNESRDESRPTTEVLISRILQERRLWLPHHHRRTSAERCARQTRTGREGKLKGKPQPDASLRDTENVPLSEDRGNLLQTRSPAPCAGCVDRP